MKPFIKSGKSNLVAFFVFVIVCSALIVVDSIITRVYMSIPKEPPTLFTLLLFEGLFVFLVISSWIFLRPIGKNVTISNKRILRISNLLFRSVIINQVIICGLVASIAISLVIFGTYNLVTISGLIYICYVSAICYLVFLTYHFIHWNRSGASVPILLYTIAFSLLIINLIISGVYLNSQLSFYDTVIKMKPIKAAIPTVQSPTASMDLLSSVYDFISPLTFILIWIPTMIQLKKYSLTLGRVKYLILISAPLVYYLFPVAADFLGIFDAIRLEYGSEFNLIYVILFSPYRQVGGLLFGIVFWVTSFRVRRNDLEGTLQMAGTGMILFFGSTVLHGLSYVVAPPFGIITISFIPLASYLFMRGLYSSAVLLSTDAKLRRDIRNLLENDASLLHGMGSAEMEMELRRRIGVITKKTQNEMAEQTGIQSSVNDDDMKDYLDQVLKEIKRNKS